MPHRLKPSKKNQKIPLPLILEYFHAWLRTDNTLEVCRVMDVRRQNLNEWPRKYPEMKIAKEMADKLRESGKGHESMKEYIYNRLSEEARKVWDELQWKRRSSIEELKKFMEPLTKKVRQELFLHALVSNQFDTSTACSIVGMSLTGLQWWKENDEEFMVMFKEVFEHRNNFYQKQLNTLVEMGHPGAVIFVNETVNADRGYRRNVKIEHSGHVDTGFDFEALDLDMDTRLKILDAIRRKKLQTGGTKLLKEGSIDAEVVG